MQVLSSAYFHGEIEISLEAGKNEAHLSLQPKFRENPEQIILHIPWFVDLKEASADGEKIEVENGILRLDPQTKAVTMKWEIRPIGALSYDYFVQEYKEKYRAKNKKILDMFNVGQNRIQSMALIHESLYQSKDLARINFSDYIKRLTTHLFSMCRTEMNNINLKVDIGDVSLDVNRAIPCGLIINELISNSLEHGFPVGEKGQIAVEMDKNKGDKYRLKVSDTGIGFPEDVDFQNTKTLGMQLVTDLVR